MSYFSKYVPAPKGYRHPQAPSNVNSHRYNASGYLSDHSLSVYDYPLPPAPVVGRGFHNYQNRKRDRNRQRDRENRDHDHHSDSQGDSKPKKSNKPDPSISNQYVCLLCPGCFRQFEYSNKYNKYKGRLPLILNCRHTVCQECIYKMAVKDNIVCPQCKNPSVLPEKYLIDELQEVFSLNFYVMGVSVWFMSHGKNKQFSLVPVGSSSKYKRINYEVTADIQEQKETCCFLSCNNPADSFCHDCNDIYCDTCFTIVHKSAKSLWSHRGEPLPSNKLDMELKRCEEHGMDVDFFCKTCEEGVCCYCFLEKHESHEKEHLAKLSDEELYRFNIYKEKAEQIFKNLLISQKKIKDLFNYNTVNAEQKITNFFMDLYAKFHFMERNLRKEIDGFKGIGKSIPDLENISNTVNCSVNNLREILIACNSMDIKKLNLKNVLAKLEETQDISCYLVNENNKNIDPVLLEISPILDKIDDWITLRKNEKIGYKLISCDELPPDFKDPTDVQYESDIESCMSSLHKSFNSTTQDVEKKKNNVKSAGNTKLENEMVDVTHIESLECFYVQLKKMQFKFLQLTRELSNYAQLAATVDHPQLGELYLAQYVTKKEKFWCRGRLVEIKNGETEPLYEVFFIDYGNTQTLNITMLRELTHNFAQPKPFAIQCELYNPTNASWNKNAHVFMGKMINGKEVYMLVKNVVSGVHLVDLMVSSSSATLTSIVDILIQACSNALNTSSEAEETTSGCSQSAYCFTSDYKIFSNNLKLKKNQSENVIIANIIDPHHIFVQIAVFAESLQKMTSNLKTFYKNVANSRFIPVEGSYVIVMHKDPIRGNWHRALIKKVNMNTEEAQVTFVDWGCTATVPWNDIRMLTESYTKLDAQALLVKLAHIQPYNRASAWSENSILFLQKYFVTQESLKMVVYNVEPLEVVFFEVHPNLDICVNAQLVAEKLADSTGKISLKVEWHRNLAEPPSFKDDEGLLATLLERTDLTDDDGDNSDAEEEKKHLVKQKIDVVRIVTPDLIYIKFECQDASEQQLRKELQIHYNKDKSTKPAWHVEENCVVLYTNYFVRGKVVEKVGEKYKVYLYDTGEDLVVDVSRMFIYATYFTRYPSMVFKSHLANIRAAGGEQWSLSSIEALEKIFEKYKDIYGTKVDSDLKKKSLPMQMWYKRIKIGGALVADETRFVSINDKLVKLGFAYRRQQPKIQEKPSPMATECADVTGDLVEDPKEKGDEPLDWNDLIDEEEKKAKGSPYRTCEANITDWIPSFPIKMREFNAFITCAEIGGIIYLRDEALQKVYKEMEANIKEYFVNEFSIKPCVDWKPGQLCTIHYNGFYYRGKIYDVKNPNDITVVMIDFGSDHKVKSTDLYREILYPNIPAFASRVKLARVYAKSGAWLSSDYEMLLTILTERSKIFISGSLETEIPLAEVYTNKDLNVNNLIVGRCPNLTHFPYENDGNQDSDDDNVVIEEEESIVYDAEKGESVEEPSTSKLNYKFETFPLESPDDKLLMAVVTILSYNKIVLKPVSDSVSEELIALSIHIQSEYAQQPLLDDIRLGVPCICPYAEDDIWYRAQIYNLDGIECGYVFVFFVDYGNVESVSVKDLRIMKKEWFELPTTCYIATLNVELKIENHTEHVLQHMKKLRGKHKLVGVVKKEPLTVDLYEENSELCYQALIENGLLKLGSD